jgi:hypothetical protein
MNPLRGRVLLPYERPAAERAWEQYENKPEARMHQNYGPEGMALLAAARAGSRLTFGTGVVGLLLYAVLSGLSAVVSYALLALAFALAAVGTARGLQAASAGRRFRGGRPYVRRPGRTAW